MYFNASGQVQWEMKGKAKGCRQGASSSKSIARTLLARSRGREWVVRDGKGEAVLRDGAAVAWTSSTTAWMRATAATWMDGHGGSVDGVEHAWRQMGVVRAVGGVNERGGMDECGTGYTAGAMGTAAAYMSTGAAVLKGGGVDERDGSIEGGCHVPSTVFDILKTLVGQATSYKGLDLMLDVAPEIPDVLTGDSLPICQVITNLVRNTIKFTEIGYVALNINAVSLDPDNVTLQFCVRNSSIRDIAQDKSNLPLDTLCQADGSTTWVGHAGTGMGLSKHLTSLMQGDMESELGKDSELYFTIKSQINQQQSLHETLLKLSPVTKQTILLVDTMHDNTGIEECLSELGLVPVVVHHIRHMRSREGADTSAHLPLLHVHAPRPISPLTAFARLARLPAKMMVFGYGPKLRSCASAAPTVPAATPGGNFEMETGILRGCASTAPAVPAATPGGNFEMETGILRGHSLTALAVAATVFFCCAIEAIPLGR
ncbi:hypothetical protein DFH08DRAFT_987438 [Mycena albidolilacea]|uniref:Uncharacterized protein n=1 Tax=Mycena albidolilacea TaxID=1033008 RepID=A0AAD7EW57_9AGAR|nr:hypothetical protein DFH08DRAFT_987438 [Mycena albidolilacea]